MRDPNCTNGHEWGLNHGCTPMDTDLNANGWGSVEGFLPAGLPHIFQVPVEQALRGREVFHEPHQGGVNALHVAGADPVDLNKFCDRASAEHIKDQERPGHPDERAATAAARFVGGLFLRLAHVGKLSWMTRMHTGKKRWLTTFSEFYRDFGTARVPEFISQFGYTPVMERVNEKLRHEKSRKTRINRDYLTAEPRSRGGVGGRAHPPQVDGGEGKEFQRERNDQHQPHGEEGETGFGGSLNLAGHRDQRGECGEQGAGVNPDRQSTERFQTRTANEKNDNQEQVGKQQQAVGEDDVFFPGSHGGRDHATSDLMERQP